MMNNEELKEFRLMLDLSCKEAADLMYLTRQQILNIETGKANKKSTMYLMELCYKKYLEDHKRELEERINNHIDLYFRLMEP